MRKIAVVTDSSAAIDLEFQEQLERSGGFAMVPLGVSIENKSCTDLSAEQLEHEITIAHVVGAEIKTASPGPGVFSEVYTSLFEQGFESIISLHLSSYLSSTVESARVAARQFSQPIYVIDSANVAMALGFAAISVYDLADSVEDAKRLASVAFEMCENAQLFFYIPTVDALKRGGRVHPGMARVAQMFQIRPVATVQEGRLMYLQRPRSIERAKEILLEYVALEQERRSQGQHAVENELTPEPQGEIVAIHYAGNLREAKAWAVSVSEKAIPITPLPAVLSAHTGLGALAVVVY